MSTIYIITGQTATGKTNYALDLAKKKNGELVNFDSRQIYKHLDIITGKDLDLTDKQYHLHSTTGRFDIGYYQTLQTPSTKIWLYDIVDPKFPFSAFDYNDCAIVAIQEILKQNKTPILVGGTYFYIKQLLYGTIQHAVEPDWELRKNFENNSVKELQQILKDQNKKQFEALNNSEKNNPQRLIRWIEISKNKTIHSSQTKQKSIQDVFPDITIKMIGITPPSKEILQKRIYDRVEKRMERSAIQEVEKLLTKGYTSTDPGLRTIGYAQILKYINQTVSIDKMITEWMTKEIQYAKRQHTFMKKDLHIEWIAM